VLFDTLVEELDRPQVESVLAHELAHWKKGHVWKLIGVSALQAGLVLGALGYLLSTGWVYDLFGLARENLANPFPHPWYTAFNHQHPPIPERMQYIEEYAANSEGDSERSSTSVA